MPRTLLALFFCLGLLGGCGQTVSPHGLEARPAVTTVSAQIPSEDRQCSLPAIPTGNYLYEMDLTISLGTGDTQRSRRYTMPDSNSCRQWLSDPASERTERALPGDGLSPRDEPLGTSFTQTVVYQIPGSTQLVGTTECTTSPEVVRVTVRAGTFDAHLTTCRHSRPDFYLPRTVKTWQHVTSRIALRREITWRISRWESHITHELIEAPPTLTRSGTAHSS